MAGPAPNSGIDPLAILSATNNAAKGQVDPKTIAGVASSAKSVGEATTNVQAIAQTGNMVKLYDTINGMQITHQAEAWSGLKPSEQASLRSFGYKPPDPDVLSHVGAGHGPSGGGGIWGDIMGGIQSASNAVGGVETDVGHAITRGYEGAKFGLNVAGRDMWNAALAPKRAVLHAERARIALNEMGEHQNGESWQQIAQQNQGGGLLGGIVSTAGHFWSPSAWAQAWDMTTNGNTTLDPAQHQVLVNKYGHDKVQLAITVGNAIQSNGNADSIIQSAPPAQQQNLINEIRDPKFQQLVQQVGNAKISDGRMWVGSQFLNQHPLEGKLISGSIDAATDYMADPTNLAGKGMEAYKLARYAAPDASAARALISRDPAIQRQIRDVGSLLEQGRYGELGKVDPRLEGLGPELAHSNVHDATTYANWLVSKAGQRAILGGDAAQISHQMPLLGHTTYLGWMKSGIKNLLSNSIDRLADGKVDVGDLKTEVNDIWGAGDHSVLSANDARVTKMAQLLEQSRLAAGHGRFVDAINPARLVRRMATYIPDTDHLVNAGPHADIVNFRRMIEGFTPAKVVDELSNIYAVGDEGQRRFLQIAAMKQQAMAAGGYNTAKSADAFDKLFAAVMDDGGTQAYGVNDYDAALDDHGVQTRSALYPDSQTSGAMRIILPNTMRAVVRSQGVLAMAGVDPMPVINQGMKYWRTLVLDRPGFAVRVAIDENVARLLRDGPKAFAGSFMANGAAPTRTKDDIERQLGQELENGTIKESEVKARRSALTALSYKQISPIHPVDRLLQILADRAPEGARSNWKTIHEFYGGVMGGMTRKWVRQAENKSLRALGLGEYIDGATHLAIHQPIANEMLEDVIAKGGGAIGYDRSDPRSLTKFLREGLNALPADLKTSGFSVSSAGDPWYSFKWQGMLDGAARDRLGQAALHSMDMSREDQIQSVLHVLNDPDYAATKSLLDRSRRSRLGIVGTNGITQDDVDRDLAESVVDNTNAMVHGGEWDPNNPGPRIQELVDLMKENGAGPDVETLERIMKNHQMPAKVAGPDILPDVGGVEGLLNKSMETLVGKPMNWLTRQPHLIHQYTHALRDPRAAAMEIFPDAQIETSPAINGSLEDIAKAVSRHFRSIDPNAKATLTAPERDDIDRMFGYPSYHALEVWSGKKFLGHMLWDTRTGRIQTLGVEPEFQRRGVATAIWDSAREAHDLNPGLVSEPVHSDDLSESGEAWVNSLKGRPRPIGPKNNAGTLAARQATIEANREKWASDVAMDRAVKAMLPYIHNPKLRTQFEDYHRVLFPFLFAQRQFLLRWGRTFKDSPSAVRQLQLGWNGLRTSGIVQKDQNGNYVFYYPGSQYITEMVSHVLNRVGIHATIPFAVPFTGEVKYLVPGPANPVTPSLGPGAAIGMKEFSKLYPEMTAFNNAILGQGAAEPNWQQLLPSIANRTYEAFIDKLGPNEAGSELASATIMMMKYMDANGQGLPQNATPSQIQQYVDRLTTGARDILLVRAALGFVMPATPTAQLDPQGLDSDYRELLQILPYDTALQQFYKEHPNGFAYAAGTTDGATSGQIPATQQDLNFTNQHADFAKNYPAAFPWLAPRSPGQFSLTEFLEQENTGQRTALPVWNATYGSRSVLANIMNARASGVYYQEVDNYDKAYASTTDPNLHKQYTQQYDEWKASFEQRNPVFAQYLTSQQGKQNRNVTITQVRQALNDPALPQSPAIPALRVVLNEYDNFNSAYTKLLGNNSTEGYDTKTQYKNQAVSWGNNYIKSHPEVADFWNTIMRPQIDETTG